MFGRNMGLALAAAAMQGVQPVAAYSILPIPVRPATIPKPAHNLGGKVARRRRDRRRERRLAMGRPGTRGDKLARRFRRHHELGMDGLF